MTILRTEYVLQVEGSNPPVFLSIGNFIFGITKTNDKNKATRLSKKDALKNVEAMGGMVFNRRWPIDGDGVFEF